MSVSTLANFVDGNWVVPNSEPLDVVNPATGETLARVPMCGQSDVDQAVGAAYSAL